ncbi:hypothetical protein PODOV084v1_p0021 [Vibrio phage 340E47.2]|nr:hypothetical protein PODOV084v1_p0021 [Vibrio phage 340E47.2]QZI91926.1 putative endonuclease [Vibrio phage 5P1a]
MSDKLKPCPFCGAEPMHYKSFTKVTIGCRSADCHVNPTFSIGKRDNPEEKWNSRIYDRMVEEIAELKGAIEAAVRIKELWLPMGAFSDSPPEHYAEIEALHKMANKFEKALAKLNQEGEE